MITINNDGQKIISTDYRDSEQPAHAVSGGGLYMLRTPGL
ncbi:hypothetical protein SAMN05216428_1153 [Nitrosospira sp. Nsp11]|nr:hypothetical protein SAMN05216428_1153 [Nitrosospira sp. Nsp11]